MAAALACGRDAVLSHRTAAVIHGILRPRDGAPHVTVPASGRSKRRGIVLHQVRAIGQDERGTIDGLPVTSLARTLLDLARTNDALLDYAIEEAADKDLLDLNAIAALGQGRKGMRRLREALTLYQPTPAWTRSNLEKLAYKGLPGHGVPRPALNQWVAGYEVDMVWDEERVILEIDGSQHDRPAARERDTIRDAKLQIAGFAVIRARRHRIENDLAGVAADVNALLYVRRRGDSSTRQ
jgi:hypothetical protein